MTQTFPNGQRVRSKNDWQRTGTVSFTVPGDGKGKPWYVVQWEDGTESTEYEDDLEVA